MSAGLTRRGRGETAGQLGESPPAPQFATAPALVWRRTLDWAGCLLTELRRPSPRRDDGAALIERSPLRLLTVPVLALALACAPRAPSTLAEQGVPLAITGVTLIDVN